MRPARRSASSTSSRFFGSRYWMSARCSAFSCGLFGTYTGCMVRGSTPVKYMAVDIVEGVG